MKFINRQDAGKKLAQRLKQLKNKKDVVLLALPRGGLVIAHEISKTLKKPVDILIIRKISAPHDEEWAIGAMAEDFKILFKKELLKHHGVKKTDKEVKKIIKKEIEELKRRLKVYRHDKVLPELKNKTVVIIDDGVATGMTLEAAVRFVDSKGAKQIIVAIPVADKKAILHIAPLCDNTICVFIPKKFGMVDDYYKNFKQVSDKKVIAILHQNYKISQK
jgi:predicted phosphoribosyltransferase